MTTSPMSPIAHRMSYAAAAALAGSLMALTAANADASPGRADRPAVTAVMARTAVADGHAVEHACFITPHTWNAALDGPLPRCFTHVA